MEFIQLILGTYFITSALHRTDGPNGILYKLRKNESLPFYCFTCLVIYIAAFLVLISFLFNDNIGLILPVAGGALLLNDLRERLV